jgi:hypothetical protein
MYLNGPWGALLRGKGLFLFVVTIGRAPLFHGVTVGGPPGPACPAEVETKAEAKPRGTAEGVGINLGLGIIG